MKMFLSTVFMIVLSSLILFQAAVITSAEAAFGIGHLLLLVLLTAGSFTGFGVLVIIDNRQTAFRMFAFLTLALCLVCAVVLVYLVIQDRKGYLETSFWEYVAFLFYAFGLGWATLELATLPSA